MALYNESVEKKMRGHITPRREARFSARKQDQRMKEEGPELGLSLMKEERHTARKEERFYQFLQEEKEEGHRSAEKHFKKVQMEETVPEMGISLQKSEMHHSRGQQTLFHEAKKEWKEEGKGEESVEAAAQPEMGEGLRRDD